MGRALGAATKAARAAAGWELARAWRLGPCAHRAAAETGAMLRVRCLRGGSRGAEAVHYIGSRVSAYAASGPLRSAGWGPEGGWTPQQDSGMVWVPWPVRSFSGKMHVKG